MNLVAYFLRDLLRNNLASPDTQKLARRINGAILFDASGMLTTLVFRDQIIELQPGNSTKNAATIKGDLSALLEVALGANYLKFLVSGKIKISGNIFTLLKLMRLMQVRKKL